LSILPGGPELPALECIKLIDRFGEKNAKVLSV